MEPTLAQAFRAFAADPHSELAGALLVSRIVRPDTDTHWCEAELLRLADRVGRGATVEALIAALKDAGFAGAEQYYAPDNSALDFVLRERRGIPISLAIVVLAVAERIGLPALGINFPGHFLVAVDGQLVDPFTLTLIDAQERDARLASCGLPAPQALRPATPVDIVLRMLNNLRGLAIARGDHADAIRLTDYQLLVTPDPFAVHLARIELWNALGATTLLQHEIEQAIATAPSGTAKRELQKTLQEVVMRAGPTMH
jgi:regulator of sirC expression with transglutaminase-like and TPR domain